MVKRMKMEGLTKNQQSVDSEAEIYGEELKLIGYCGIYCRLCDYFTGKFREVGRKALELVEKHPELKIFAECSKEFGYEELLRGLRWLSEMGPCIGACRGRGGWSECPLRKCCIERRVTFCYECEEYPCKIIKEQFPKAEKRLNELKRLGIERWVKKQLGTTWRSSFHNPLHASTIGSR